MGFLATSWCLGAQDDPKAGREWNLRIFLGRFKWRITSQSLGPEYVTVVLAHYSLPCYIDPLLSLGELFSTQLLGQLIVALQWTVSKALRSPQFMGNNVLITHPSALDAFWWTCSMLRFPAFWSNRKYLAKQWISKGCQKMVNSQAGFLNQPTLAFSPQIETSFIMWWQAWFNKNNVMNLHVGQSPNAGIKCVGFLSWMGVTLMHCLFGERCWNDSAMEVWLVFRSFLINSESNCEKTGPSGMNLGCFQTPLTTQISRFGSPATGHELSGDTFRGCVVPHGCGKCARRWISRSAGRPGVRIAFFFVGYLWNLVS